jgi:DNA-binding transcriptional LysR family regulator
MDLRQLDYFHAVYTLKSFTKAARKMCISQPSITISIRKLEDELGLPLFDRSQRKITLTDQGHVFLQRAETILSHVEYTLQEMKDYKQKQIEVIRVGLPPMIGSLYFPHLFTTYIPNHPEVNLVIHELDSEHIIKALEAGDLDLGLIILSHVSPGVVTKSIGHGEIQVCLSPSHPLAAQGPIPFAALRDEPFILTRDGTFVRKVILDECKKHHFTPHILFTSVHLETIRVLIANGVGIGFLQNIFSRNCLDIVSLSLAEPLIIQTGMAWKQNKYLTKAMQNFIDYMSTL